ncbi:MAG: hypothetical protein P9L91_06985 [Candidatus Zophobacter franzmannii]|nr:hypothetical protein [Candidatus Zophobacter franzmannii]
MFDFIALEKWGIHLKLLPKDSEIINRPDNSFSKNKRLLEQFSILILFLSIIILILMINTMKRRKLHNQLVESHNKLTRLDDSLEETVSSRTEELDKERVFMSTILDNEEAMVIVVNEFGKIKKINNLQRRCLGTR